MSTTTGRVLTSLTRTAFTRRLLYHHDTATVSQFNSVRPLALSSQRSRKSRDGEVNNEPIKFSTSKASHKVWKVDQMMGGHFERPWWKVMPMMLVGFSFILWCILRDKSNVDAQLDKSLYDHFPGLLPEEEGKEEDKAS